MLFSAKKTAIGRISIGEIDGSLSNLFFENDRIPETAVPGESDLLCKAFTELDAYLAGKLKSFSVPLSPCGTPFMLSVWREISVIPYGSTATYRDIAIACGHERAVRAVGTACRKNPLPVFIPCHRVVGSDGHLTGYRGGLFLKNILLDLENRYKRRNSVSA